MYVIFLLLALVDQINSVLVKDNVVIQKVSEVAATQSIWLGIIL